MRLAVPALPRQCQLLCTGKEPDFGGVGRGHISHPLTPNPTHTHQSDTSLVWGEAQRWEASRRPHQGSARSPHPHNR
jgi:hypothetical protein